MTRTNTHILLRLANAHTLIQILMDLSMDIREYLQMRMRLSIQVCGRKQPKRVHSYESFPLEYFNHVSRLKSLTGASE